MKRKRQSSILLIGMLVIGIATVSRVMSHPSPIHTTGTSVSDDTTQLQELRKKLSHFAENIRFQYDSSVFPTASIRTLDSIIHLMHEHGEEYQYIIRVHSYESGQTAAYALQYSNSRANAIRTYLINQGITPHTLLTQGMGSSDRKCFDEHEPDCYHKNNRLEMDVRKMVKEDYIFVDLHHNMGSPVDTRLADKQLLTEAFERYFTGDETTMRTQVNLSPCQTTIIETYNYYGNPHIRLWTFHTDLFTIGPGLNGQIRIDVYRGTVYDSRIKSRSELREIHLTGIPKNSMKYRDKLEHALYRYKEHCNEPPEAY